MAAMKDTMIINGVPVAWATPVLELAPGGTLSLGAQMKFDNITTPVIGFPFAGDAAAAGGAEFIEVTRGDGAIIQFPKDNLRIDGTDESVVSSSGGSGTDTAAIGTISFTALQADMDSASYLAFINKLKAHRNDFWLVCVPIGENYVRRHPSSATTPNAAGFAFLLAKLSGSLNLSIAPQTGAPVQLQFQGTKYGGTATNGDTLIAGAAFPGIPVKGVTPVYTVTPPTPVITAAEAADILKGDILFK